MRILPSQADICKRYGVEPQPPIGQDRLGIALATLQNQPINGLRVPALSGSSGWFIFGGSEAGSEADFYSPLCTTHICEYCDIVAPYLCLPAGWRFQIDSNGYEDVWYDPTLMSSID